MGKTLLKDIANSMQINGEEQILKKITGMLTVAMK